MVERPNIHDSDPEAQPLIHQPCDVFVVPAWQVADPFAVFIQDGNCIGIVQVLRFAFKRDFRARFDYRRIPSQRIVPRRLLVITRPELSVRMRTAMSSTLNHAFRTIRGRGGVKPRASPSIACRWESGI